MLSIALFQFQNSPFYTFSRSIVKLITTVSGELDFQDIFGISSSIYDTANNNINDQSMAYFVWILFIIGVPIIFSNMLVSYINIIYTLYKFSIIYS